MTAPEGKFAAPPDPGRADGLDALTESLRQLKLWAGDPSYETIKARINAAWTAAGRPAAELTRKSTVAYCFTTGRRRLNADLTIAVVEALHPDVGYVSQWRQALRVISGETAAAAQVRVQSSLPPDPVAFVGRGDELDRLRHALRDGDAVVISAIEGMAGIGKTQLAIHAGHLLHREEPFERVLFVNLRGFHPDPAQPPAGPGAVLDGFLRLLDVPGQQIPHNLGERAALYRERLAGVRALVVLDNAADAEQVRPLLPATPGCLTVVTSRRSLAGLGPSAHLTIDVFTPGEAIACLRREIPGTPNGEDPQAMARIARRCAYLPLALGLVAGHIRATSGWTLTDHADRLDEPRHDRNLDEGVGLAFDLSYRRLAAGHARLLRLASLHPGQDFDAYAAAAIIGSSVEDAAHALRELEADHLLQEAEAGRYTFHDLVHAYVSDRARDEDRPADRRAAMTRLFDHYLATAAAAMDVLHPGEAHARPGVPPAGTPSPDLSDVDGARRWLDTERPNLVALAVGTAEHGLTLHTTRLARVLYRYLVGGHHNDAEMIHGQAYEAARKAGDPAMQAHALTDLGISRLLMSHSDPPDELFAQALTLFRQVGDLGGQARALFNLGFLAERNGRFAQSAVYVRQHLDLCRQTGDVVSEARALNALAVLAQRVGNLSEAIEHSGQAMSLYRVISDQLGESNALVSLGEAEQKAGRYDDADGHLRQALAISRKLGDRYVEVGALDALGQLHTRLGRTEEASAFHQQSLVICREDEDRDGETWALNGLGEAHQAAGRPAEAVAGHTSALAIAEENGHHGQEARAHLGLGHAHRELGELELARQHYSRALALSVELGSTDVDQIRTHLQRVSAEGHGESRPPR